MLRTTYALFFSILILAATPAHAAPPPHVVATPMGDQLIDDPLALELLDSPAMRRIADVAHLGLCGYYFDYPSFSRWDHCLGVYLLLRHYGASREECIAGLLHDASHTVFSHLGDRIFGDGDGRHSYQDGIHAWYLKQQGVDAILARYGLTLEEVMPERHGFNMLDGELPDLCADRIEYNLHPALLFGDLDGHQLAFILQHLHHDDGVWYFDDPQAALLFSRLAIKYNRELWLPPKVAISEHFATLAFKRCLEMGVVTYEEMHFGSDSAILQKVAQCHDPLVQQLFEISRDPLSYCEVVDAADAYHHFYVKDRATDPLVRYQDGRLQRLSEVDASYAEELAAWRRRLKEGIHYNLVRLPSARAA